MYTSEDVLEAARVIRPYLPDLIGEEAEVVALNLAELLAKSESRKGVDNQILELLAERDNTRNWTRKFLENKIPPPVLRAYNPLAGSVSHIDANAFICPVLDCNYVWYQPKVGITPPSCPEHKKTLVKAQPDTA